MKVNNYDVAIVGAGPAGISAAIYLKRAGVEPLVFERKRVGGLLINANLVENYPGFPDGIAGKELVQLFESQVNKMGIEIIREEVLRVEPRENEFLIGTNRNDYTVKFIVLAAGTIPKEIDLNGYESLLNGRLFYEIADIPPEYSGKHFLIIGGGDAAFDYALNLAGSNCEVDIVFRSETPKCIPLLFERARNEDRIRIFSEYIPERIFLEKENLILECRKRNEKKTLHGDFGMIAFGRTPNLEVLPEDVKKAIVLRAGETEIRNLFLIGDVARGINRQIGIAVGDGINVAMEIVKRIEEEV